MTPSAKVEVHFSWGPGRLHRCFIYPRIFGENVSSGAAYAGTERILLLRRSVVKAEGVETHYRDIRTTVEDFTGYVG